MPFKLYLRENLEPGVSRYTCPQVTDKVPEALRAYALGQEGPIWHMTEQDVITGIKGDPASARDHALVIDLKPKVVGNVSLYRVRDIWGWTDEEWTPIALRLWPLFSDLAVSNAEGFKHDFDDRQATEVNVYEFLYLRGGRRKGWNWGMVGFVNGALLWPEVWEYFAARINETVRTPQR